MKTTQELQSRLTELQQAQEKLAKLEEDRLEIEPDNNYAFRQNSLAKKRLESKIKSLKMTEEERQLLKKINKINDWVLSEDYDNE